MLLISFVLFLLIAVIPSLIAFIVWKKNYPEYDDKPISKIFKEWLAKNWWIPAVSFAAWIVVLVVVFFVRRRYSKPVYAFFGASSKARREQEAYARSQNVAVGGRLFAPINIRESEVYDQAGELPGYRRRKQFQRSTLPAYTPSGFGADPEVTMRQYELAQEKNRQLGINRR